MPRQVKRIRDGITRRTLLSALGAVIVLDIAQARRIRFPNARRLGRGRKQGPPLTKEQYEACRELQFQIAQTEPEIIRVRQELKTSRFRLDDLGRQNEMSDAVLKHAYQTDRESVRAALEAQQAMHDNLRARNRDLITRRETLQTQFEETCAGRYYLPPEND